MVSAKFNQVRFPSGDSFSSAHPFRGGLSQTSLPNCGVCVIPAFCHLTYPQYVSGMYIVRTKFESRWQSHSAYLCKTTYSDLSVATFKDILQKVRSSGGGDMNKSMDGT